MYVYFNSSSKLANGLKPVVSEVCSLKLCSSDKSNFIGPLVQDNIIEGLYATIYIFFFFITISISYLLHLIILCDSLVCINFLFSQPFNV